MRFTNYIVAALLAISWSVMAETSLSRVSVVVPFGLDGATGQLALKLVAEMQSRGVSALVLHKPGAGGIVGANYLATAHPDTLGIITTALLESRIGSDISRFDKSSFSYVSSLGESASLLIVGPKNDINILDVVSGRRDLRVGHSTAPQLVAIEGLQRAVKSTNWLLVPYKSPVNIMTDLIGSRIDMTFIAMAGGIEYVRSGQVKAIGITSLKRNPALPDVPAIAEYIAGYKWVSHQLVVMPSSASPKSIFYYESMLSDILKNSPSFIDFTRGFPMYMGSVKHGRAAAESIVNEIK